MSHYKQYPAYKDSNIPEISLLPEGWSIKPLKHHAEFFNSNVDKKSYEDGIPTRLCNYTDVYYNEFISSDLPFMKATASESEIQRFTLKAGDVIITKDSEDPWDIGVPAMVKEDMPGVVCGYHLTMIRAKDLHISRFIHRLLQSLPVKSYLAVNSPGITRFGLGQDVIGSLPVPTPPAELFKTIADKIDRETSRIDALISKKTRFIELLKEKRQALITHAVTKGLDPNVKMKDSGVEWIGEVPEHWDIKRLRHVAIFSNSNVDKKSYEDQKEVRLCNYTDVYYNEFITSELEFMSATASDSEIEKFQLRKGDVIITKDSEDPCDIGVPALVTESMTGVVCGYHLTVIRTFEPSFSGFVHRTIQADTTKAHLFVRAPGITRFGLNQDAIGDIEICVPPKEEYELITTSVNKRCLQIDLMIESSKRSISLLKERRSAFITAAVTGQIDLREGR